MSRHARQQFSANLEHRCAVRRALLHAGQRRADLPHGVEVDCASWHGCDYPQEPEPFQGKLLQLRVRVFCLFQNGDFGVGVFV
jgi:hypothetical protein